MEKENTFEGLFFKLAAKELSKEAGKNPVRFAERLGLLQKIAPRQAAYNASRSTQIGNKIVDEMVASKNITKARSARKLTSIQEDRLRK